MRLLSLNLVNSSQPNLRTIYPLDYDQRHSIIATVDYRYGWGKNYNGPRIDIKGQEVRILENAGANFYINIASGTPYSAAAESVNSGSLKGQPNGSRRPWQYFIDAQFDKSFMVKVGEKADEDGGNPVPKFVDLNVYLQCINLFNIININDVYRATGNWDDDGYLAAPQNQAVIAQANDEQSYQRII